MEKEHFLQKKLLDFYLLVKCSIVIVSYIIKIDAIVLYTIR